MCVEVRREYSAESTDPERAARFAAAALLKTLQPSDWQICADVELVVEQYVQALRDRNITGTAFVEVTVHRSHVQVVVGSDDPSWVDEKVRLRPRRPFTANFDCHLSAPRQRRAPKPALWPALARPRVETTAGQWRDTWDALHEITQGIRDAGEDLTATMDAIAAGVVKGTVFTTAAVNLVQEDGSFRVVAVHGPPELAQTLLGVVEPAESWQALIDGGAAWGSLCYVAPDHPLSSQPEMTSWTPSPPEPHAADRWDPEDVLFAPLYALDGTCLGTLSVDVPRDGRRPGVADLDRLEVFADHAAAAIERIKGATVG